MFHIKNGLYFEHGSEGSVVVIVKRDNAADAPTLRDLTLSDEEWAKVISVVSAISESIEGVEEAALKLHHGMVPLSAVPEKPEPSEPPIAEPFSELKPVPEPVSEPVPDGPREATAAEIASADAAEDAREDAKG